MTGISANRQSQYPAKSRGLEPDRLPDRCWLAFTASRGLTIMGLPLPGSSLCRSNPCWLHDRPGNMPIICCFFLELANSLLPFHKGSQTFFLNVKNILRIFQKTSLFMFGRGQSREVVTARGNIEPSRHQSVRQGFADFSYLFLA